MPTPREQYALVAGRFDEVVRGVPDGRWDDDAPCEGWVARDVVRHLVEWVPGLFSAAADVDVPEGPSPDDDPVGAWAVLHEAFAELLADPATADRWFDHPMAGRHPLPEAVSQFLTGDLLVHTWDLAAATGQDRTIDAAEAAAALEGMEPLEEMLRGSGHYGPRVEVGPDASVQDRLVAFTGRDPRFGLGG